MRPLFGLHLPDYGAPGVPADGIFDRTVGLAIAAEDAGFDLVTVMDHVYQIGKHYMLKGRDAAVYGPIPPMVHEKLTRVILGS